MEESVSGQEGSLDTLLQAVARTPKVGPVLAPGCLVDHFRVTRLVGSGGMAEVYQARDTRLGRKVALKVLHPGVLGGEQAKERFLLEARATARFSHPHITAIHAVGEADGRPYVALEFLDGQSLRERLREGPLSARQIARLGVAIAEALAEAHRQGVLHRDLKPENVMLPADGRPRVVDFGLAKLVDAPLVAKAGEEPLEGADLDTGSAVETQAGRICGTPLYMSPEQWRGQAITGATDLWSLGVLLFELVFRCRPYDGVEPQRLAAAVCASDPPPFPPPPPEPLDERLLSLLRRCLSKDAERRPSAAQVAEALRELESERSELPADTSPFRGLLPFDEEHRGLFFGRDDEAEAFVEGLRRTPIMPIVGPSGAGKSSFVRAAVIPRLRRQGPLLVLALRPGRSPFTSLAAAFIAAQKECAGRGAMEPTAELRQLASRLSSSPHELNLLLHDLADRGGSQVLLFVDQLEELATDMDPALREAFLQAICTASDDVTLGVRVVLTAREEFLGPLADALGRRGVPAPVTVLARPGPQTLAEALYRPVAAAGYSFDDATLVDEMVATVAGEASCLPLLQFAGQALWERRDQRTKHLTRAAHDELGGVAGALARHADSVLDGLSASELELARTLLSRLVTPEATRRALSREQLVDGLETEPAERLLRRLTDARLVVERRVAEHLDAELELVHEALILGWGRLRRWIEEGREELYALAELEQAATLWANRGESEEEVWQGDALQDARRVARRLGDRVPSLARRFLRAGIARQERASRVRRLRWIAATVSLGLLAVVGTSAALVIARQKQAVERQRRAAELQRATAQREGAAAARSQGRLLEARAKLRGALETQSSTAARLLWWRLANDPLRWRRQLGCSANGVARQPAGELLAVAAANHRVLLFDAVTGALQKELRGHGDQVFAVAFSPDGQLLASGARDGSVLLWDVPRRRLLRRLGRHRGAVHALTFVGPRRLASGGQDKLVRLWDLETEAKPRILRGHRGWVLALAAGPRGLLASGSADRTVRVWRLRGSAPPSTAPLVLTPKRSWVTGVAFVGDGRYLAAVSQKTLYLWHASTGKRLATAVGHRGNVRALVTARRGSLLATAGRDGRIVLWRAPDLKRVRILEGHEDAIFGLAFGPEGKSISSAGRSSVRHWSVTEDGSHGPRASGHRGSVERVAISPDGKLLASAGADRTVRLWDANSGAQLRVLLGSKGAVRDVRFSPDGRFVAAATQSDTVPLWRVSDGRLVRELRGRGGARSVAFSPDGRWIAAAFADLRVRLWESKSGAPRGILAGHRGTLFDLAFHPSGNYLAAASHDRTIRIWNIPTARLLHTLRGHLGRPVSLAFDADGRRLVSADVKGELRGWQLDQRQGHLLGVHPISTTPPPAPLRRFSSRVYWLAFHPTRPLLGVPLADGTARLITPWKAPGDASAAPVVLRGHRRDVNAVRFDPGGRFAFTASDDGTVRRWRISDGHPEWRAPLLLPAPAVLLSHRGWIRLRDGETLPGTSSRWRKAAVDAVLAAITPRRQTLCLVRRSSRGAHLEQWDPRLDRRRWSRPTDAVELLAHHTTEGSWCVTRSRQGSVEMVGEKRATRLLPAGATALARHGQRIAVATASGIRLYDASGELLAQRPEGRGSSALDLGPGGETLLGYPDGAIERIANKRSSSTFEQLPASRVTALRHGPRDVLFAGFENGEVGLWSHRTGKRLHAAHLHGAVRHLLYQKGQLYAATELGDYLHLDLRALEVSDCALLHSVWRRVPVLWRGGRAERQAPPADHPCAQR